MTGVYHMTSGYLLKAPRISTYDYLLWSPVCFHCSAIVLYSFFALINGTCSVDKKKSCVFNVADVYAKHFYFYQSYLKGFFMNTILSSMLTPLVLKSGGRINIKRRHVTSIGIPMLKIRRSHGRLIFNMGILIPWKMVFILRQGPV